MSWPSTTANPNRRRRPLAPDRRQDRRTLGPHPRCACSDAKRTTPCSEPPYGAVGACVAEHLRLIAGELQLADVRTYWRFSCFPSSVSFTDLQPGVHQMAAHDTLMDEVI